MDACGLDEDDPEYSFPPDEEDIRLKDPEELRDDRATKESPVVKQLVCKTMSLLTLYYTRFYFVELLFNSHLDLHYHRL